MLKLQVLELSTDTQMHVFFLESTLAHVGTLSIVSRDGAEMFTLVMLMPSIWRTCFR
jgi:hypothetical protein